MKMFSTALAGILAGWILVPGVVVQAQTPSNHSVVLVAHSDLSSPERAALTALLDGFGKQLGAEDRLGVILYSDIVEHVAKLSSPSTETTPAIERVLDALPAVDASNGAVGIDRAIELLSTSRMQNTIIVVGNLEVQLEDAVLTGRYSRWLDGTLLPTIESKGIALMAITGPADEAALRARIGSDRSIRIASLDEDAQSLMALALQPVPTRTSLQVSEAPAVDAAPETNTTDRAVADTPISEDRPGTTSTNATVAVAPVTEATPPTTSANAAVAADLIPNASLESTSSADGAFAAPVTVNQGQPSGLTDRLASFALAPLVILGMLLVALASAGAYLLLGHQRRRSKGRHRRHASPHDRPVEPDSEATRIMPLAATLPGFGVVEDDTLRHTSPRHAPGQSSWQQATMQRQDNVDPGSSEDDSRFDALIDSISQPTRQAPTIDSRPVHEDNNATIETPGVGDETVEARTVDTRRKPSRNSADLTRELEDLTRARNAQYDFE